MLINLLFRLPSNIFFDKIKSWYLFKSGKLEIRNNNKFGMNFQIKGNVHIKGNLSANSNVLIAASGKCRISIGNYVLLGPNCVIRNADHGFSDINIPIRLQKKKCLDIIIEDDVWVASNCIILKGSVVKKGCIIGAGSVVTKNDILEPYGVYAGKPLKLLFNRKQKLS